VPCGPLLHIKSRDTGGADSPAFLGTLDGKNFGKLLVRVS
jgi:NADPH-dependent curcumin reductase CurA